MSSGQDQSASSLGSRTDSKSGVLRMAPRDLYRLRRAHLMARRANLRAQYAQQQLDEMSLELERRYGLLAKDATLDMKSGAIAISAASARDGQPEPFAQGVE